MAPLKRIGNKGTIMAFHKELSYCMTTMLEWVSLRSQWRRVNDHLLTLLGWGKFQLNTLESQASIASLELQAWTRVPPLTIAFSKSITTLCKGCHRKWTRSTSWKRRLQLESAQLRRHHERRTSRQHWNSPSQVLPLGDVSSLMVLHLSFNKRLKSFCSSSHLNCWKRLTMFARLLRSWPMRRWSKCPSWRRKRSHCYQSQWKQESQNQLESCSYLSNGEESDVWVVVGVLNLDRGVETLGHGELMKHSDDRHNVSTLSLDSSWELSLSMRWNSLACCSDHHRGRRHQRELQWESQSLQRTIRVRWCTLGTKLLMN